MAVTPDGKSAYVANQGGGPVGIVSQYSIHPRTGKLSPKSPATVAAGDSFLSDVAVSPDADMSVKVSAPSSVKTGSRLTYTITVANRGPSSAWQIALKDVLPYGTQFQRASATSGRCTAPKAGRKGGRVTCALGTITPSNSPEVRIVVKVTAKPHHGQIVDSAIVSSVTPDPNHLNNRHHRRTKVTK